MINILYFPIASYSLHRYGESKPGVWVDGENWDIWIFCIDIQLYDGTNSNRCAVRPQLPTL